jgi:hypothetical protein
MSDDYLTTLPNLLNLLSLLGLIALQGERILRLVRAIIVLIHDYQRNSSRQRRFLLSRNLPRKNRR